MNGNSLMRAQCELLVIRTVKSPDPRRNEWTNRWRHRLTRVTINSCCIHSGRWLQWNVKNLLGSNCRTLTLSNVSNLNICSEIRPILFNSNEFEGFQVWTIARNGQTRPIERNKTKAEGTESVSSYGQVKRDVRCVACAPCHSRCSSKKGKKEEPCTGRADLSTEAFSPH